MNRQLLEQPFPAEMIKQRTGSFGKSPDYIEGHAVIQRLNEAFDGNWSFEIVSHEVLESEVAVLGKLSAEGISKVQFGSSQITKVRDTGEILSLADDLKAVATDALKKAATLFGVGLHLYAGKSGNSNVRNQQDTRTQAGNSNRNPETNQDGGGRLSQKQLSYLLSLADERSISRKDLNQMSLERFGVNLEFLSKTDASNLIGELMALAA